jgi:3-oxoacyl-[acyl-carrier protein] reductase
MRLKDRVAIVTGASGGIGRALAAGFAREGAAVVVSSRAGGPEANAISAEICAAGGTAVHIAADVTDPAAVQQMVAEVLERFARVDILVNNAGLNQDALLPEMSQAQWDQVLGVNLSGVFHCTQAVIRPMALRRSGVIINISSVAGEHPLSAHANYNTAKAAVNAFTRSSAIELARFGIRVNAVSPGFIDAGMSRPLLRKSRQRVLSLIPLRAFGQPEDVAQAALFLASEEARYITGEVLHVSGGLAIGLMVG